MIYEVKRPRALLSLSISLVALVGGLWLFGGFSPRLPRIKLQGGGEFRVYKICYGGTDDHRLGGWPTMILQAWKQIPLNARDHLPDPDFGESNLSPYPNRTALSIFWAWIDPSNGTPTVSPSGEVIMTTDDGEQRKLNTPSPFDAVNKGGSYRQIFISPPPNHSRRLHFRVPVEDEIVEFTIRNPAYGK